MYYVYRYMIDDQWIYVGKSKNNLIGRINDHAKDDRFSPYKNAKIEYCELNTTSDMDLTESMLIKTMHPVINIVDKTDGSVPFFYDPSIIHWIDYSQYVNKPKEKKQTVSRDTGIDNKMLCEYLGKLFNQSDSLGLRYVLDYWCRIEEIPFNEFISDMCINKKISISDLACSLRKHFETITNNTSYKFNIITDGDKFILVFGRDGRENINEHLL